MGVMELSLLFGLFFEPDEPRRFACWRLRSFSLMIKRITSRWAAIRSRCISSRSASVMMWGDPGCGEAVLELLAMLWTSSSKTSWGKRSSSDRKEVALYSLLDSESEDRRGQLGKAQLLS